MSLTFTTIVYGGGIHPTLAVRTMPSNNYFIYETDESIRNKPDARQAGEHNED